jgi:hypothetical protein
MSRLSRGSSQQREGESSGRRPPPTQVEGDKGAPEEDKMGPASPEMIGSTGGRRGGGEKRKAGRNLRSPSPAT